MLYIRSPYSLSVMTRWWAQAFNLLYVTYSYYNLKVLGKIWKLSDHDKDGYLDDEEFALGWFLTDMILSVTRIILVYYIGRH